MRNYKQVQILTLAVTQAVIAIAFLTGATFPALISPIRGDESIQIAKSDSTTQADAIPAEVSPDHKEAPVVTAQTQNKESEKSDSHAAATLKAKHRKMNRRLQALPQKQTAGNSP